MAQSIIQQAYENLQRRVKRKESLYVKQKGISLQKKRVQTEKIAKQVVFELLETFRSLQGVIREELDRAGLSSDVKEPLLQAIHRYAACYY